VSLKKTNEMTDRRQVLKRLTFALIFLPPLLLRKLISPVEMVEIWAKDNYLLRVWLDGFEVSRDCTGAYMPAESGIVAEGWCEVFAHNPPLLVNGEIVTERRYGLVEWRPLED
jgi:hypothetical protein